MSGSVVIVGAFEGGDVCWRWQIVTLVLLWSSSSVENAIVVFPEVTVSLRTRLRYGSGGRFDSASGAGGRVSTKYVPTGRFSNVAVPVTSV
jgi:hypothetical protein